MHIESVLGAATRMRMSRRRVRRLVVVGLLVLVQVSVAVTLVVILVLVAFAIGAAVVIEHLASKIERSARNDTLADEVTNLEVCSEQVLEILVVIGLISVGIGTLGRIEEVEERVLLDLLRDGPPQMRLLVLLNLLDHFLCYVLALLPVDRAAFAGDDLGTLIGERLLVVNVEAHRVLFGEDMVGEVVVFREHELEREPRVFSRVQNDTNVIKRGEDWLVVWLNHLCEHWNISEDAKPKLGDTFL
jgi:hypothetical protein